MWVREQPTDSSSLSAKDLLLQPSQVSSCLEDNGITHKSKDKLNEEEMEVWALTL